MRQKAMMFFLEKIDNMSKKTGLETYVIKAMLATGILVNVLVLIFANLLNQ